MSDPNTELMQKIRALWGDAIAVACKGTDIPPAFLAALIANESGGNPSAKRFEPGVLVPLWQVLQGQKADFGSIGRQDILDFLLAPDPGVALPASVAVALQRLNGLATSWGLTQIMGYNIMPTDPSLLADPATNLRKTVGMLNKFAVRFQLAPGNVLFATSLFHCWNAGSPGAATASASYAATGVARMCLYPPPAPIAVSA